MEGKTPLEKLRETGYTGRVKLALFPPLLLDSLYKEGYEKIIQGGQDLLTQYTAFFESICVPHIASRFC